MRTAVLALAGCLALATLAGCAAAPPARVAATGARALPAPAPSPEAPDHPDTLAFGRRLIVDAQSEPLRALVGRLGERARARAPVDSLALVRAMELWSEYASQPNAPPDSAAYAWALAAVRVKERVLGADHHELAHSLGTLGAAAESARDLELARECRERAVRILRDKRGRERAGLMTALDDLGRLAYATDRPARAESLMREAVAEGRAGELTNQPRFQSALNNLAVVLVERGKFEDALGMQESLLALRLRQFGPVHRRVQLTRINLGVAMIALTRYERAAEEIREALRLDSLLAGQGASRRAPILLNLAGCLELLGDFAGARRLLEGSLAASGPDRGFVRTLLADSYRATGEHERARALYEEALRELRSVSAINAQVSAALVGLAALERAAGRPERAIPIYREAVESRRRARGAEHSSTAQPLLALAECELAMGRLDAATAYADSARHVLRLTRPRGHPEVAGVHLVQAEILERLGQPERAGAHLDSADATVRATLGEEHPQRAETLDRIARLAARRGNLSRAFDASARAEAIRRRTTRLALATLTEAEALNFRMSGARPLDVVLTCAEQAADSAVAERAFDETIRSRALLLDAAITRRRLAGAEADSAGIRLAESRRKLARLWVAGLRDHTPQTYQAMLDAAMAEVEAGQKRLAGPIAASPRAASEPAGLAQVRGALPPGAVLVSIAHYLPAPTPLASRGDSAARYLAFVLRAGGGPPAVVSLGPAAAMDDAIHRWSAAILPARAGAPAAEPHYRKAAAALTRRLWSPLAPHLRGAARVFLVPDGQIHLVDLATLPEGEQRYVLDVAPPLAHLTAESDLVKSPRSEPAGALLALGHPEFDATPAPAPNAVAMAAPRRGADDCAAFARRSFPALPASGLEIQEVASLWSAARPGRQADLLEGAEATESRLRAHLPGASDLHLATHGFFLPERCADEAGVSAGDAEARPLRAARTALLRAGVALAGANRRESAEEFEDDGILTAEEIASFDLRHLRSAVISACESGQGEPIPGEGLFGLRRALRLAGVESMVMSLWPVEDPQARAWMRHFYESRWREGADVAVATRAASRALLEYRRRRGRPTHPSSWAGFVAIGGN